MFLCDGAFSCDKNLDWYDDDVISSNDTELVSDEEMAVSCSDT